MKNFISASELQAHRDAYVVLDCRGFIEDKGLGHQAYLEGHIPGAQYIEGTLLSGTAQAHGGRHPLPDMEAFAAAMAKAGVSNSSKVVVYDTWVDLGLAGRLWWMLTYIGVPEVKLLEGGFPAWVRAGYPVVSGEEAAPKPGILDMRIQQDMLVEREEVFHIIADKDRLLVDARAPERYRGEMEPLDPRPGHIPGASNTFFAEFFTPEGLISQDEIEAKVAHIKRSGKPTVIYCGSGISAPLALTAMGEAGIAPVMYLGSMSDWQSYEGAPLCCGDENVK